MNLVYLDGKSVLYTTSEIVAECAGVQHHSVTRLLKRHQERFEAFGVFGYEIHKPNKNTLGGRPKKVYCLNEQQATLLVTYLDNTPQVAKFKSNLVKAFFEMRDELQKRQVYRAVGKQRRKELTDAIKEWQHANKWSYKAITDLLLKKVTKKTAKQLKQSRRVTALDCLSSEELKLYQKYENLAVALIGLNADYNTIKTALC